MAGFASAILAVVTIAVLASRSTDKQAAAAALVTHTMRVREQIAAILSGVKDAETGQRGYLLTGQPEYLEPFERAATLGAEVEVLRELTADNPLQRDRIAEVAPLVREKLSELRETIDLRRAGDAAAALAIVRTGRGKSIMQRLRAELQVMMDNEQRLLEQRSDQWRASLSSAAEVALGGTGLLLVLIMGAGIGTFRELEARESQAWLRNGQAELSRALAGEQSLETLAQKVLDQCVRHTGAVVGTLHVVQEDGGLRRVASHALAPTPGGPHEPRGVVSAPSAPPLPPGAGIAGQAIQSRQVVRLERLPPSYLQVSSALGATAPLEVWVVPAHADGTVLALIELAFLTRTAPRVRAWLEQISESVAIAVRTAIFRARLVDLLRRTQEQAQALQTQQEELRVTNEELEVQSRALQESQARLESQHTELEQSNDQLQEQATLLERQRDELLDAQRSIERQNDALERANRHKSEFLANMSHELRTPLNSALILAKLLSDNKSGNLTAEQVRFASTIYTAGNDLLALINDILDLSKVEAGKLDVHVERVEIAALFERLQQTFRPTARQRGLAFRARIAPDAPITLETDLQRLEQVLKNLVSNALKFTEHGEVELAVAVAGSGSSPGTRVAFSVKDTGVGIPPDQLEAVFQAFKQLDAGANRRYSGTGLGLSISRDLARLLGGDILVTSTPGVGSTFTLILPEVPTHPQTATATAVRPGLAPAASTPTAPPPPPPAAHSPPTNGAGRRLLIVEDDTAFAEVLSTLGKEQGFTCGIASRADQAVQMATSDPPSAILLDIGLPDHSGLSVLDRVKRNPATRHIPVHVISAADASHAALEMGAIGYAVKPVARDDVLGVLRRLSSAIGADVRRVLVVEDDDVQRDSICHLLAGDGVEAVGVATVTEGLARLREVTFGCMVLDLNLPDVTGYDMLETMAADDRYAIPPVIVYTAGAVTPEEEARLQRFSGSIIIKGARSPERLLDEVSLFLHQVEERLPPERRKMLQQARDREALFEDRVILIVEDDVRNIFALSSVLEPRGAKLEIARNGREALERVLRTSQGSGHSHGGGGGGNGAPGIDLVLMDIMMPEMDGLEAIRQIRSRPELRKLPIIALTAKAMRDDQEKCLAAGANDYVAKPIDIDKLLSLIRVWMPR
jgi:signal transduction histidine kinase/DNA-binding response OmpR family regulator/CHASE3 domain sensor protein